MSDCCGDVVELHQNVEGHYIITARDPAGALQVLTGYDLKHTARDGTGDDDTLLWEKTVGSGIELLDQGTDPGKARITFTAAELTIAVGDYVGDVLIKPPTEDWRMLISPFVIQLQSTASK